jgi:hypothetical protein
MRIRINVKSRIRIRIRINVKSRIRIRISVKSRIRIRIKVMRGSSTLQKMNITRTALRGLIWLAALGAGKAESFRLQAESTSVTLPSENG